MSGDRIIRVLHLEDDPLDAELVQAAMELDTCEVTVVSTRDEFVAALEGHAHDLIISDFSLPGFDGASALEIARDRAPEVPFIMVSGQLGEEAAVESVRNGATDYVLKQRLARLGTSIRRALSEARERARRREAEASLAQKEAQLQQAQKMEAVGRLAGGVAHDFNNLLTVISGYSQLLERKIQDHPGARGDVGQIIRAAERAAGLTRQLLAFSRQQVLNPRVIDLNRLIQDFSKMVERLVGAEIQMRTNLAPDLGQIHADAGQVEQIILNLVVNARDAMPAGGVLTIETRNLDLTAPFEFSNTTVPAGSYVVLCVCDTGTGIPPEVEARMFDPFFTTKDVDKGTGLGLSTVHGIISQSRGHIGVVTRLKFGTSFHIHIPRVVEPVDAIDQAPASFARGGSETVLVIDDDNQVLQLVQSMLESAGYRAITARNRDAGMKILESRAQKGESIDLVVSDIHMPGLSRAEFDKALPTVSPGSVMLHMSGNATISSSSLAGHGLFLQKPFTNETLLEKVREALDARNRSAA